MDDRSGPRPKARRATVLGVLGVLLLVGAPATWLAAGAPGAPGSQFGGPTGALAGPGPGGATAALAEPPAPAEPAASPASNGDAAPDTGAVPSDAISVPLGAPEYTSTAPRGAIDRTQWPTEVAIPALRVRAPVAPVGVATGGELIIPASPMDVGWYQGGAVPGDPGVALLTSHIDTRTEGRGVLSGLVQLSAGDAVELTAADGSLQRWSVVARTQHRKDELPPELFSRAGDAVLALVTCGGPFDSSTRSYRDNVVVWAEPVP